MIKRMFREEGYASPPVVRQREGETDGGRFRG